MSGSPTTGADLFRQRPEFVSAVRRHVEANAAGISEYALLRRMDAEKRFEGWISAHPSLALFQKHFALMHTLYRLQDDFARDGRSLTISPLAICLSSSTDEATATQVTDSVGDLRGFYLDWHHFTEATPESVERLLRSFWQRFNAVDKAGDAFQTLDLEPRADWSEVQVQYRRLAARHHPDKGGDRKRFAEVRNAYETLKGVFGK